MNHLYSYIEELKGHAQGVINDASATVQDSINSTQSSVNQHTTPGTGGIVDKATGIAATTIHTVTEQLHNLSTKVGGTMSTGTHVSSTTGTLGEELNQLKEEALAAVGIAQQKTSELFTGVKQNVQSTAEHASNRADELNDQAQAKLDQHNSTTGSTGTSGTSTSGESISEQAGAAVGTAQKYVSDAVNNLKSGSTPVTNDNTSTLDKAKSTIEDKAGLSSGTIDSKIGELKGNIKEQIGAAKGTYAEEKGKFNGAQAANQ